MIRAGFHLYRRGVCGITQAIFLSTLYAPLMTTSANALLPTGLYDLLPPKAAHERFVGGRLAEAFERFGYAQVAPPLMEFEASLLAGRGAKALSAQTFRVMDPHSQQMMGYRSDITLQVGRIAAARMANAPRPLRLSYGGSTLRVRGEGREGARQWRQAGIELIGSENAAADAEVIAVAAHSIAALGVRELVADINFPGLVGLVLTASGIAPERFAEIRNAVESKDAGWIAAAGLDGYAASLAELMDTAGEAHAGMQALEKIELPEAARGQVAYVQAVIDHLRALDVPVELTIDPVENKGFEYHSLVSFSLFSRHTQSELGRGGRYSIHGKNGEEPATGMTLYVNTLLEAVALQPEQPRLLLGGDTTVAECVALQEAGYITVRALDGDASAASAKRMGCTHVLSGGNAVAVG